MLGRYRHNIPKAQRAKVLRARFQLRRIHLVHGEKQRLASALQQSRQLHIRRRQFRPPIHHHDNRVSLFQRHARLPEDLRRNQRLVIRHHTARVDNPHHAPGPLRLTIDAVARNPRLIAHNRPPRPRNPVEQRRFPNIRPPADSDQRHLRGLVRALRRGVEHLIGQLLDLAILAFSMPASAPPSRSVVFDFRSSTSPLSRSSCSGRSADPCPLLADLSRSVRGASMRTARSRSGLRFGVRAAFSSAAFFELSAFRFFGATFAICAPVRGALPLRGRVLACRCFLPILFFCSRLGAITSSNPVRLPWSHAAHA